MSETTDIEALRMIEKLMAMPEAERKTFVDQLFFNQWGVTREQFWELDGSAIEAIAEARGLNVAGIGKGGKLYQHQGDGKDKRN